MKGWRPQGWTTPDRQDLPDWSIDQIYEAGANDMLEAIQKHFNLTMFSARYNDAPVILAENAQLLIGIKPEGNDMPYFLSSCCFKGDYLVKDISISGEPLEDKNGS